MVIKLDPTGLKYAITTLIVVSFIIGMLIVNPLVVAIIGLLGLGAMFVGMVVYTAYEVGREMAERKKWKSTWK